MLETPASAPDAPGNAARCTGSPEDGIPPIRLTMGSIAVLIIGILIAILWIFRYR